MSFRLASVVVAVGSLAVVSAGSACKEEKSGAEKLAEALAASASAAASARASAKVEVDPNELKFKAATKGLEDRMTAYLVTAQKLYEKDSPENRAALKAFFPKGDAGEKDSKAVTDEVAYAGTQGMTIRHFEVSDPKPNSTFDGGTVNVLQTEVNRGKTRCVGYKLTWKDEAGALVRDPLDPKTFSVVPCTP